MSWYEERDRSLTANFTLKEFIETSTASDELKALAWGSLTQEHVYNAYALASRLQLIRDYLSWRAGEDVPLIITSGFRPKNWEHSQGRSGNSRHTNLEAADFNSPVIDISSIYSAVETLMITGGRGLNVEQDFVHYDIRPNKVSWSY